MRLLKHSLFFAVAGSTAFLFASTAAAQTLHQRPPAQPASPVTAPVEKPQPQAPVLPAGTPLQVEIARHYPMKAGEPIEGHLLYPLYADGKLAVAANTPVHGTVTKLSPDKATRWHSRLRGDFTPFHTPTVTFKELMLPSGPLAIQMTGAATGATVLRLSAPGAKPKQSFVKQEWEMAKGTLRDRMAVVTAPGRKDRALQMLYHQLPYHPERLEAHTAWSFELAAPALLPNLNETAADTTPSTRIPGRPETWAVHAVLQDGVTSANAKAGDAVNALVVEPVYDKDRVLVVPQGSTLIGKVTAAKAARSLGRNGKLRFTFQQVRFPQGAGTPTADKPVEGALAGATTEGANGLALDAEGTISPKGKGSVIAPLLLVALAGRALDNDGNLTAQTGVASNGFGLVGRVVGVAVGNRSVAAGLGYYAAALSFYDNFLHKGHDVVFPKDTRVEIETTPVRAPVLTTQQ